MHSVSKIISDEALSRIIQIESAGRPTSKAKTSSATGLGQFISATWLATVKKHRPDLMRGRSRAEVLALRTDPRIAIEMLARFTEDNASGLGNGWSDGDLYLAHFLGLGAAKKVFRASPGAAVAGLVGAAAVKANPTILRGKTAGEVRAWAERKMASAGGRGWIEKFMGGGEPTASRGPEAADRRPDMPVLTALAPGSPAYRELMKEIQAALLDKGYKMVRRADGRDGTYTRSGVTAFQRRNDLSPADGAITQETYDLLLSPEARGLEVAPERENASTKDIAEKVPEVGSARKAEEIGFFGGIAAFFGGIYAALKDYLAEAIEFLQPIRDVVSDVPVWVWFCGLLAIIAGMYWQSRKATQAGVQAFRVGDRA